MRPNQNRQRHRLRNQLLELRAILYHICCAERSIEDELGRSVSDVVTIAISYCTIFAYIVIALSQASSFSQMMVSFYLERVIRWHRALDLIRICFLKEDSKITLDIGGVFIVLLSVLAPRPHHR